MAKTKPHLNQADIELLKLDFVTKEEFNGRSDSLEKRFFKQFDKIITMLDQVIGELKSTREEQTLQSHKLVDHEDRIEALESQTPTAS